MTSLYFKVSPRLLSVQITLEQDGGSHLVHFFLAFVPAHTALDQDAVGDGGGEAFVPHFDGHSDGGSQDAGKGLDLFGGGAVTAIHIAWHAEQDNIDFLFIEDLPETFEELGERLGGNKFQWLRDGFSFIADGDTDAPGAVIKGENSHSSAFWQ